MLPASAFRHPVSQSSTVAFWIGSGIDMFVPGIGLTGCRTVRHLINSLQRFTRPRPQCKQWTGTTIFTLLVVVNVYTLHIHTAGSGTGYSLHVHTAGSGKGYNMHVHILLMVERDTPCTSKLLAGERHTVHRHFISVCYVSGMKRIGIKRIAA